MTGDVEELSSTTKHFNFAEMFIFHLVVFTGCLWVLRFLFLDGGEKEKKREKLSANQSLRKLALWFIPSDNLSRNAILGDCFKL